MKKFVSPVFFNASVVIAGLISPEGASGTLLSFIRKGILNGVISEIVFDEIRRHERLFSFANPRWEREIIRLFPHFLPPPEAGEISSLAVPVVDPGDAHLFVSCLKYKIPYLVSLDRKHILALAGRVPDLAIVSPGALLYFGREALEG